MKHGRRVDPAGLVTLVLTCWVRGTGGNTLIRGADGNRRSGIKVQGEREDRLLPSIAGPSLEGGGDEALARWIGCLGAGGWARSV